MIPTGASVFVATQPGTVRPSAFAVPRLIASWNLFRVAMTTASLVVTPAASSEMKPPVRLIELGSDFVDARLRAFVVFAGRTGNANRSDHVATNLDRQPSAER